MVKTVTSLGRSGLQDWVVQRVTAVILTIYTGILISYSIFHPNFGYLSWRSLFENPWMRYCTLLALLSLSAHAWIGLWTVTTDYIKSLWLRLMIQILIIIALLGYLVWGIQIIWILK